MTEISKQAAHIYLFPIEACSRRYGRCGKKGRIGISGFTICLLAICIVAAVSQLMQISALKREALALEQEVRFVASEQETLLSELNGTPALSPV